MNENDRAFLPDRIRIPRHALAGWSRVRARLHKNIDAHRLQGDEGVITDARIAAEMIGLCEAALGIGSGIIAEEGAPVYEADDRLDLARAMTNVTNVDLALVLRKIADRLETGDAASE